MILVSHLINLLISELEIQDELLGLLIRERVAIARKSQTEMEDALRERKQIETKLNELIERRQRLFRSVEEEMKLPAGELDLTSLSLLEDGELSLLGESLATASETIVAMREQNRNLRLQSISGQAIN